MIRQLSVFSVLSGISGSSIRVLHALRLAFCLVEKRRGIVRGAIGEEDPTGQGTVEWLLCKKRLDLVANLLQVVIGITGQR